MERDLLIEVFERGLGLVLAHALIDQDGDNASNQSQQQKSGPFLHARFNFTRLRFKRATKKARWLSPPGPRCFLSLIAEGL